MHSKLFLCAELSQETDVDSILKNEISLKLETLSEDPMFSEDAVKYLVYINQTKALDILLDKIENENPIVRSQALNNFKDFNSKLSEEIIGKKYSPFDFFWPNSSIPQFPNA